MKTECIENFSDSKARTIILEIVLALVVIGVVALTIAASVSDWRLEARIQALESERPLK